MDREIKFRGKNKFGWHYGYFTKDYAGNCWITSINGEDTNLVEESTIGQFTGFYAAKCKTNINTEIYEGDLFRSTNETDEGDVYIYQVVVWVRQRGAFYMIPKGCYEDFQQNDLSEDSDFSWLYEDALMYDFSIDIGLTKVGNIHESEVTNG